MRRVLVSLLLLTMMLVLGGGGGRCFAMMGLSGAFGTDYLRPAVLVIDGESGQPTTLPSGAHLFEPTPIDTSGLKTSTELTP